MKIVLKALESFFNSIQKNLPHKIIKNCNQKNIQKSINFPLFQCLRPNEARINICQNIHREMLPYCCPRPPTATHSIFVFQVFSFNKRSSQQIEHTISCTHIHSRWKLCFWFLRFIYHNSSSDSLLRSRNFWANTKSQR